MNYTNNRNNRRYVSFSTKSNIKESKEFDKDIKRDNIIAAAAASTRNIATTTRDKSCIQTILDSLDGYYNDDERVQRVDQPPSLIKPPIRNLSFSSLRLNSTAQIPKEIIKKESSPPPTVPQTPKHSNKKKGLPKRRHSLPDNAKLPDNVKLNQWAVDTAARTQKPAVEPPRPRSSAQPIKQTRRRRHTLSGNTAERPDISCIQSLIRQSNIHEEDYYHHLPKNKLAVVNNHEFERVDQTQTHSRRTVDPTVDHKQSSTSNNNNNEKKSQVKRIIERRRRHSMPDNMKAPNPSDLLMSLPLPASHCSKGLDKQQCTAKRLDHTSSPPPANNNKNEDRDKNKNENEEKYRYKVGQTLQDATSHSLRFTSKSQATKTLSQLSLNTPLFVKRTSNNQQWQAQWSYCILVKHIYNENKLIGVEVSLTDLQQPEGKDKKSRVRTKIIEEKYFERCLMMVNYKTVLVQDSTTTTPVTSSADDKDDNNDTDDQTDMATRGSEPNHQASNRPPRMIFRGNKEDVNSSIYSSSSSSSSSSRGESSTSKEFYSVISSTESFSSSSIYSSSSSDTSSSYDDSHVLGRYLDFNSPIPLSNTDDVSTTSASTTSARSSYCSSGASDQVLIANKSARLLRASL